MTTSAWFPQRAPGVDAPVRLVCFAHAGAGAVTFSTWASALPGVEVCALELPGRAARYREQPYSNMERLADVLVRELTPLFDRPVVFFGHSLGARLAFQVALREPTARVRALVACGTRPPSMALRLVRSTMSRAELVRELERFGATPAAILADRDFVDQLILPVLRADFALAEYRAAPDAKVDCPLHVVVAKDDHEVTPELALGWKECTRSTFTFTELPDGGHFFVTSRRDAVLAEVRKVVAAVT